MVKYFCDVCNAEITKENEFAYIKLDIGGHKIILAWDREEARTTEDVLCKYCVIDKVKSLDDRPSNDVSR